MISFKSMNSSVLQYWVSLFDHFAGSYALMGVAFFEVFAVIYVYGWRRLVGANFEFYIHFKCVILCN